MPGALLQLNTNAKKTDYLTINPQISYFKSVYLRYHNYAKINFDVNLEHSNNSFLEKQKYTLKLPKYGDLIKDFYVKVNLPSIYCDSDKFHDVKWVDNFQYKLISSIRFSIAGRTIQEFSSEFLYLYYTLGLDSDKKEVLKNLTGQKYTEDYESGLLYNTSSKYSEEIINGVSYTFTNKYYKTGNSLNKFETIIPIPVWFSEIPFPIVNLEYVDINVEIIFNPISEIILVRELDLTDLSDIITSKYRYAKTEEISDIIHDDRPDMFPKIMLNYIYLDELERVKFAATKHQFLINAYNLAKLENVDAQSTNMIEIFGTTQDLIIVAKNSSNIYPFNFTNYDNYHNDDSLDLQNYIVHICRQQYTYNNLNKCGSNLTVLDLLRYFVNDKGVDDLEIPYNIFTVLYAKILNSGITSSSNNIIIKLKPSQSIKSSDIIKLREIWRFRDIKSIPDINRSYHKNIINSIALKFNKMYRLEDKDHTYFNLLELSKYYKTSNDNEISLYSFSIDPIGWKPKGYCNFSYINKFEVKLDINKSFQNTKYDVNIYNRYYNILSVNSGLASLLFFK